MKHVWQYLYDLSPLEIIKNPIENKTRLKYLEEVINYIKSSDIVYKEKVYLGITLVDLIIKDSEMNHREGLDIRIKIIEEIYSDVSFDYLKRDEQEHIKLQTSIFYKEYAAKFFHQRLDIDSKKGIVKKVTDNALYYSPEAIGMTVCYFAKGTSGIMMFSVAAALDMALESFGYYSYNIFKSMSVGACASYIVMDVDALNKFFTVNFSAEDIILRHEEIRRSAVQFEDSDVSGLSNQIVVGTTSLSLQKYVSNVAQIRYPTGVFGFKDIDNALNSIIYENKNFKNQVLTEFKNADSRLNALEKNAAAPIKFNEDAKNKIIEMIGKVSINKMSLSLIYAASGIGAGLMYGLLSQWWRNYVCKKEHLALSGDNDENRKR